MLSSIQSKVTAFGKLRNGRIVEPDASAWMFVSAELHLYEDGVETRGSMLTWARRKSDSGKAAFLAVDENARKKSLWPRAPFDVRETGAIESRGCTDRVRGTICAGQCKGLIEEEEREQERLVSEREKSEGPG